MRRCTMGYDIGRIAGLLLLLLCFFVSQSVLGQNYLARIGSSQNPPDVQWMHITTPHFEVVYPWEMEDEAQRVANTLEHVYLPISKTLNYHPEPITVILNNRSVVSNGYVQRAPRRSVWYGVPTSFSFQGPIDWYDLLATHETRHMVQLDKLRATGFNRIAYLLFGDYGADAMTYFSVPQWYFEGDAVGTETALTSAGRGRRPEFDLDVRTLLLAGSRPSYYKAVLRSYRNWYPDHYVLGYLLTTYVKRTYGPEAWDEILRRTARWSYVPNSFDYFGVRRVVKKRLPKLYREAMADLESRWREQQAGIEISPVRVVNQTKKRSWTNYTWPQFAGDGSIISQKHGLDDVSQIVRIAPDGTERFLTFAPHFGAYSMHVAGNTVVWEEERPDIRWGEKSASILRILDIRSKEVRDLTRDTRYFAPAVSPDESSVVAVEFDAKRDTYLVLLDAKTGEVKWRVKSPDNAYLMTPTFSPDGQRVVVVRVDKHKGTALSVVHIGQKNSGQEIFTDILQFQQREIARPMMFGDVIYFNSPQSGIDAIYGVHLDNGAQFQVVSRPYGAFNPSVSADGKTMIFNDYSALGFDIAEISLDAPVTPLALVEDRSIRYFEPLIGQESGRDILQDVPRDNYSSEAYKGLDHRLTFHSWSYYPDPLTADFVATLSSANMLDTLHLELGYTYNWNERVHAVGGSVSYGGLFPILDLDASVGGRATSDVNDRGTLDDEDDVRVWYHWREEGARLGVRLPLNFSRGVSGRYLSTGSSVGVVNAHDFQLRVPPDFGPQLLAPVTAYLEASNSYYGYRDFNPPWGQIVRLKATKAVADAEAPWFVSAQATLFFPGLGRHHSLYGQVAAEMRSATEYQFPSEVLFPRGYDYITYQRFGKLSVNYAFPIWYPDLGLGFWVHVKRLKANVFADVGADFSDRLEVVSFQSVGIELMANFHILTLPIPLEVGVRTSYLIGQNRVVPDLVAGLAF